MGLMTGALQIGRSALLSYQSALQVVGNNITNAGSASYSRQTPMLTPATGTLLPEGFMPGGGVALSSLRRNVDNSLEQRLRVALGDQYDALAQQQSLARIESVLNELSDTDLSTMMQEFFNSFGTLQNTPHDVGARGVVLTAGASLVSEIQRQRYDVLALRDELNAELVSATTRADQVAREVAGLNLRITGLESSAGGGANALRDQRDELLRELGSILQVQTREQPDGSVNVYVGNEMFVSGGMCRGLTTTLETTNSEPQTIVRFADNNREVMLTGGQMAGIIASRDAHVVGHVNALNSLAQVLINEVNKVHASGQGLRGYTSLTGAFDVQDSAAALNSADAGLSLRPQNGSFMVYMTNTRTTPPTRVATTIEVDLDGVGTDDSLQTLVARLGRVANLTAATTGDNRLQLTAANGFEISFGEDSSNVLAALGVNAFFTGSNAFDVSVNQDLLSDSQLIAAATQHTTGDGSNAGRLAALATSALTGLGGRSLTEFYNAIASDVAVRSGASVAGVMAADSIVSSLTAQRESLSGVNLDEEAIAMLRFERAFEAAARYTTVVDRLIQETLSLVG